MRPSAHCALPRSACQRVDRPETVSRTSLRTETLIGDRFVLLHEAGRGGMGSVYAARDRLTGQKVAVKILHGDFSDGADGADRADRAAAERFRREAEVLATLQHPGIVAYIAHGISDAGPAAGRPYLVMEWLTGEDLSQRLASRPLSLAESVRLVRAAAAALAPAHRAGIIHRDIKPSAVGARAARR